jgi:hypothetical protein
LPVTKSRDPGGNRGASMGGLETSPKRRGREAARRRREEREWAALSGEVVTYFDPSRVRKPSPDGSV